MSDFGLLSIELIRSQSRFMQAERSLDAARAELAAASEDLWAKTDAVRDAGNDMAIKLMRYTEKSA